ncbi:MAG: DUF4383 domain-containing protein [Actinobacteria bacterium]|nr:DUF4383 domain-containing protein [Actinomycetota bacterium]
MAMRQGYAGVSSGQDSLNIARISAALVGVVYTIVGLVGFAVTGFHDEFALNTKADLFGFDLNGIHNVIHLVVGLGLLGGSRARDVAVPQGMLIGGGFVYLLAAFLGFINELQIISINDPIAADNFLHLGSGLAALLLGLAGARQTANARPTGRVPMGQGPAPIEQRRGMWERPHEV